MEKKYSSGPETPPPVPRPRKVEKKKQPAVQVPAWLCVLSIVFIFALFSGLGFFISNPEKKLDYTVLAESFEKKSAEVKEGTVLDTSNFGKEDNSSQFVPRLPYTVTINPDRIDTKKSTTSKTETEDKEDEKESEKKSESDSEDSKKTSDSKKESTSSMPTGTYTLDFDMNARSGASTDSDVKTVLKKGTSVKIVSVSEGSDGSVWGKTDSGYWICMKDASSTYMSQ